MKMDTEMQTYDRLGAKEGPYCSYCTVVEDFTATCLLFSRYQELVMTMGNSKRKMIIHVVHPTLELQLAAACRYAMISSVDNANRAIVLGAKLSCLWQCCE